MEDAPKALFWLLLQLNSVFLISGSEHLFIKPVESDSFPHPSTWPNLGSEYHSWMPSNYSHPSSPVQIYNQASPDVPSPSCNMSGNSHKVHDWMEDMYWSSTVHPVNEMHSKENSYVMSNGQLDSSISRVNNMGNVFQHYSDKQFTIFQVPALVKKETLTIRRNEALVFLAFFSYVYFHNFNIIFYILSVGVLGDSASGQLNASQSKDLALSNLDHFNYITKSSLIGRQGCSSPPGNQKRFITMVPINNCPETAATTASWTCKFTDSGRLVEVPIPAAAGACAADFFVVMKDLVNCVAKQVTFDTFIESCKVLNKAKRIFYSCITKSEANVNNTGIPEALITSKITALGTDLSQDANLRYTIRRRTVIGTLFDIRQSYTGFVGVNSYCLKTDHFYPYEDRLSMYQTMDRVVFIKFYRDQGAIVANISQTALIGTNRSEVTAPILPTNSKTINLQPNSCKSSWKVLQVSIKHKLVSVSDMIRVDIPPWLGFCSTEIDKTEAYVKEYSSGLIITCYVYSHMLNDSSGVLSDGVFNLNNLPKDDCGCLSMELCYKVDGNVIVAKEPERSSGRYRGMMKVPILASSTYDMNNSPLIHYGVIHLSPYGMFLLDDISVDKSQTVLMPEYIASSQHQISSSFDGKLLLIPQSQDQRFLAGKYSSDLSLTKVSEGLVHDPTSKETLLTQYGKFSVDHCMALNNDGSEEGARNILRCKRMQSSESIIMFWICMTTLIILGVYSIINALVMIRSMYRRGGKWSIACLDYYNLFCPATTAVTNEILERSKVICSEKDLDKVSVCSRKAYEEIVINSKAVTLLIKSIALLPVLLFPVYCMLAIVWAVKLVFTILLLPLKWYYGAKFASSITFCCWFQFVYGPAGQMPKFGEGGSKLYRRIERYDSKIIRSTSISFLIISLFVWIIVSCFFYTASADGVGQSYRLGESCESSRCESSLIIRTELFFSEDYTISHPLIDAKGQIVGHVILRIVNAEYSHPLTYQFSSPSFTTQMTRLICKSDDMEFNQGCWGRFWNMQDSNEIDCDNWGVRYNDFIENDMNIAAGRITQCNTWGPKGFWWGLSAQIDGLEFIGVRVIEQMNLTGRRQWTIGNSELNGTVKLQVIIHEETLVNVDYQISRLLDTHSIEPSLGSIKIDERRISGKDLTGEPFNCEYQNLAQSSTPTCYVLGKEWEDGFNLNTDGEVITQGDGFRDYNSLQLSRTRSLGCCGSVVTFKNGNQPNRNYYGSASRASVVSGCSSKVVPSGFLKSDPVFRCSDRAQKTDVSCKKAREAWGSVQTSIPSANLKLFNCLGVKLDVDLRLDLEYSSITAEVETLEISDLTVESSGCYGRNNQLEVQIYSPDQKSGTVKISPSSKYVDCPPFFFRTVETTSFNCTAGVKSFKLTISDPEGKKSKVFQVSIKQACKSYEHDEVCDDCSGDLPQNSSDHWTWWEWLLFAIGLAIVLVIVIIVLFYSVPAAVSIGSSHAEALQASRQSERLIQLNSTTRNRNKLSNYYD